MNVLALVEKKHCTVVIIYSFMQLEKCLHSCSMSIQDMYSHPKKLWNHPSFACDIFKIALYIYMHLFCFFSMGGEHWEMYA